jgi:serine/threonine-protein kinase RsbW
MHGSVKIPSDMSNLFRAENLIDDLAEKLEFGDELYGNISVCIIEAVSNAIQHGNANDVTKNCIIGL